MDMSEVKSHKKSGREMICPPSYAFLRKSNPFSRIFAYSAEHRFAKEKKICYNITEIMKNPQLYRHILSVFIWIMLVFLVIILYHYAIRGVDWDADALGKIDMLYAVARIFFITGTISSAIGAIFAYIRNSRALEMKFVKRFFPLMRFVMSMLVWVVGGFFILEALQINTKNILAGAGIGGAILALASKDLITNLMGSLSILFS